MMAARRLRPAIPALVLGTSEDRMGVNPVAAANRSAVEIRTFCVGKVVPLERYKARKSPATGAVAMDSSEVFWPMG